jgi:hypothetical protein
MKAFQKPSLMIICSFVLGYASLFLPVTSIQYQVVTESPADTDKPAIVAVEGFSSMFGDEYGRDAFPCRFPNFTIVNPSYIRFHPVWNWLGRGLWIGLVVLWTRYAANRKVLPKKFAVLVVLSFGIAITATIMLTPDQPMCNQNEQYQLTSFTPFWLTFVFLLGGVLFAFRAHHLIKALGSSVSGDVSQSNAQP